MKTTQTYRKPDVIFGINLHLVLLLKDPFFEIVCRMTFLLGRIRIELSLV